MAPSWIQRPADSDRTHRFETSWLLSPWVLFTYRVLVSLFIFANRFAAVGYSCAHPVIGNFTFGCSEAGAQFSYFTSLTNWAQAFYFAFAALHTVTYAARGRSLLDGWPPALRMLHSVFYTTVLVFPPIVTVVYWALLYGNQTDPWPTPFLAYRDLTNHAVNSLWTVTEIAVPRTAPPPFWHGAVLVVVLGLYVGLAYLTHATRGVYVYGFLDPGKGRGLVAAYCIGILAGALVMLLLVHGLVRLRRWVTEEKLEMHGKFTAKDENKEMK